MRDPDIPPLTKRIRAITDPRELEKWYAMLTRAAAVALVRMLLFGRPALPPPGTGGDRMLKASEASAMFGVSRSWLYEHGEELGLARRPEGIRGVRFSEKELRRWAEGRKE